MSETKVRKGIYRHCQGPLVYDPVVFNQLLFRSRGHVTHIPKFEPLLLPLSDFNNLARSVRIAAIDSGSRPQCSKNPIDLIIEICALRMRLFPPPPSLLAQFDTGHAWRCFNI